MIQRNRNIDSLVAGYLFPEIGRRRRAFTEQNPGASIISLGIGNTTQPLTPHIVQAMERAVNGLGTQEGYTGYDDDSRAQEVLQSLRSRIADKIYNGAVQPDEVMISDGAKPDCGRLQVLFGPDVTVAVQDPAYPVYVDTSVIMGMTGAYDHMTRQYGGIVNMSGVPENDFFPDLENLPRTDLIYFCSPNNPTGAVATRSQLKDLVDFARQNGSIIIFDAAYSAFIQDDDLPRSIFEIEGSRDIAIEVNSFSKSIGFTGVRLGWTVVPDTLCYHDGTPVLQDWKRVTSTFFNGASNIAQYGGLAALEDTGLEEMRETVAYYMENAQIINRALMDLGITTYGGENSPYIWAHFPGEDSWQVFEDILHQAHIITTPGSGFGPSGEGFVRFSAFGQREDIMEAVHRLTHMWTRRTSQEPSAREEHGALEAAVL